MTKAVQTSVFILLVSLLASCSQQTEQQVATAPTYVKLARVGSDVENEKIILNGKVKEKSLSSLSFRVGGSLIKLKVNTGDYIQAGQVVATLDKRDYQLQLQAKKAQYEQLKGEFERYQELFDKSKIPANSFEKIKSGYLMAKTAYESAVNQLADTDLKAPFSGYIHEKFAENFQTVAPGQPIVSIIDRSQLEVVASVAESHIQEVRQSKQAKVNIKNAGLNQHPISLLSISEKTMNDGLFQSKFLLENTSQLDVRPGMSAEIEVYFAPTENKLFVPSSAVFYKDNSSYIWVYHEDSETVSKRKVELSKMETGGKLSIQSGLHFDELIVTAGVHSLEEKQKVKPLQKPTATNIGGLL